MASCYRQMTGGNVTTFTGVSHCTNSTSPNGFTPCCFNGDLCLEDGLCYNSNPPADSAGYYEALCSDPTFTDSSCYHRCTAFTKGDTIYDTSETIWKCCGADSEGNPSCENPTTVTFSAPAPSILLAEATDAPTSSSSSTSATTTSSSTHSGSAGSVSSSSSTANGASNTAGATASPSATSTPASGLGTGAAAGIGIGAAVIVVALISFAFWFTRRRRRQQDPASNPLSEQWQSRTSLPPYEQKSASYNAGMKPEMVAVQRPLAFAEMGESDAKLQQQSVVHELGS